LWAAESGGVGGEAVRGLPCGGKTSLPLALDMFFVLPQNVVTTNFQKDELETNPIFQLLNSQ